MSDLLAARSQMAMSLAFHIIFAAVGIAMPLLMVIAEWKWLRTKDEVYLTLAKRWAKGTAILFAVGAVSGTVLHLSWDCYGQVSCDTQGQLSGCRSPSKVSHFLPKRSFWASIFTAGIASLRERIYSREQLSP